MTHYFPAIIRSNRAFPRSGAYVVSSLSHAGVSQNGAVSSGSSLSIAFSCSPTIR